MNDLSETLEALFKAREDRTLKEDEYINEEGVICCKKCHTPREFVDENIPFRPRCICKCQEEERNREEILIKRKDKYLRFKDLQRYSSIQKDYTHARFDKTNLENRDETFLTAYKRCKKYVEVADEALKKGWGIYIYGKDSGVGKTHLINCIANELRTQYYPVLVLSESDILKAIKETFTNKTDESEKTIINKLVSIDFLFIDDLGTESYNYGDQSKWIQQKMYDIVDRRYSSRKPTIFSSNNSIPELLTEIKIINKTVDRITGCSNVILNIKGDSMRKQKRLEEVSF